MTLARHLCSYLYRFEILMFRDSYFERREEITRLDSSSTHVAFAFKHINVDTLFVYEYSVFLLNINLDT